MLKKNIADIIHKQDQRPELRTLKVLSHAARGDLHLIFIDDQIVVVVKMCGMTHVSPLNFLLLKSPFYRLLDKIDCDSEKEESH